jgi:UDP-glucose 4-epimerase
MDCIVTGGAGFIGSHLVDALAARGDRVTVIDNLSTGRRANLEPALRQGIQLEVADVRDSAALTSIFRAIRPDLVFHLAAQTDVRYSVEHPDGDASTNLLGTIAVVDAARAGGAPRIVNSSTAAVYGEAEMRPTREDHPAEPVAPYGQSKLAAEGYCELYTRIHGISVVTLRYANVYGPRQDVEGETGVVAIFCGHLMSGRRPTVFGDGKQTRDWVEVGDVVRANLRAAQTKTLGPVNIGRGQETSVLELLQTLNEVSHRQTGEPEFAPERPGEGEHSCLDVSRAKQELSWEPRVTLREGLRNILAGLDPSSEASASTSADQGVGQTPATSEQP